MGDIKQPEMPDYLRRYHEEIRMRQDERGRRFLMCNGMEKFRSAVEAMPIDEQERQELVNLCNVLLRMAVIKNDGGASPHRVPAF